MALAEARAAWQRTANRCLVQEDAKRAPKLACCSSLPPSVKQPDTGPTNAPSGQEIPTTGPNGPQPFNRNPSYSNLSPNSKWWLQLQPNYGHQKNLMNEQCTNVENRQMQESIDDPGLIDLTTCSRSSYENQCTNSTTCGVVSKNTDELYFDSEKNTPWWRTADTEDLALLVAQRSVGVIENCDLPRPQNTRVKKDPNVDMYYYGHEEVFSSSLCPNSGIGGDSCRSTCAYVPAGVSARSSCQKLRMTAETELLSGADKPFREKLPSTHASEDDASKARFMEALRHSQTRARQAETVAKQAYAEKEHVVKLVIRQASQLFAYKQLLHLLQLEKMYFQFINSKANEASTIFPVMLPQRSRKTRTRWQKSSRRKCGKRSRAWYDVGKCAVVLAFGLGLVGAGFLLGWTVGWMLPTWYI